MDAVFLFPKSFGDALDDGWNRGSGVSYSFRHLNGRHVFFLIKNGR